MYEYSIQGTPGLAEVRFARFPHRDVVAALGATRRVKGGEAGSRVRESAGRCRPRAPGAAPPPASSESASATSWVPSQCSGGQAARLHSSGQAASWLASAQPDTACLGGVEVVGPERIARVQPRLPAGRPRRAQERLGGGSGAGEYGVEAGVGQPFAPPPRPRRDPRPSHTAWARRRDRSPPSVLSSAACPASRAARRGRPPARRRRVRSRSRRTPAAPPRCASGCPPCLRRGSHGTAPDTPVLRCAGVRKTLVKPRMRCTRSSSTVHASATPSGPAPAVSPVSRRGASSFAAATLPVERLPHRLPARLTSSSGRATARSMTTTEGQPEARAASGTWHVGDPRPFRPRAAGRGLRRRRSGSKAWETWLRALQSGMALRPVELGSPRTTCCPTSGTRRALACAACSFGRPWRDGCGHRTAGVG